MHSIPALRKHTELNLSCASDRRGLVLEEETTRGWERSSLASDPTSPALNSQPAFAISNRLTSVSSHSISALQKRVELCLSFTSIQRERLIEEVVCELGMGGSRLTTPEEKRRQERRRDGGSLNGRSPPRGKPTTEEAQGRIFLCLCEAVFCSSRRLGFFSGLLEEVAALGGSPSDESVAGLRHKRSTATCRRVEPLCQALSCDRFNLCKKHTPRFVRAVHHSPAIATPPRVHLVDLSRQSREDKAR